MSPAALLVLATLAVWLVADVLFVVTGRDTISVTLGEWIGSAWWVVLLVGAIVGHLVASGDAQALDWRHALAGIAGLAAGYYLTLFLGW